MKSLLTYILLITISCFSIAQGSPEEIAAQAQEALQSGDQQKAIELYQSLDDHGAADIYYNLGKTYHDQGNMASAVLNYEKALKIDSGHDQALNNISMIREVTDIDIIPVQEMFLLRWWKSLASVLGSTVWMLLSILLALAWVAFCYLWWIDSKGRSKKSAFTGAIVTPILLGLAMALGSTAKAIDNNQDYAIVMNSDYDMHEGADERSPMSKDLVAGNKVKIVDKLNDWIKVQTADTETGWMKIEEISKI